MRDILFRGKRTDNGEWVEGYLMDENYINVPFNDDDVGGRFDEPIEIDPETVCQYTGLLDKNGKKIFEGDIVKLHQFLFDGDEYEKEIIVSIEYMEDIACFGANLLQAEEIKRYMGYTDENTEKVVVPMNDFYGLHEESFEVIGNIFDNPELLEEQTDTEKSKTGQKDTESVKQEICEDYCKYASENSEMKQEELDKICESCPLNKLEQGDTR